MVGVPRFFFFWHILSFFFTFCDTKSNILLLDIK